MKELRTGKMKMSTLASKLFDRWTSLVLHLFMIYLQSAKRNV